jgi:hypothetical protein
VENQEEVSQLVCLQQTKDNSAVLSFPEWDDSFSIFEDDEEEDATAMVVCIMRAMTCRLHTGP